MQPSIKTYLIDLEDGRNPLIRLIHDQEQQAFYRRQKCLREQDLQNTVQSAFILKMRQKVDEHRQTELKMSQYTTQIQSLQMKLAENLQKHEAEVKQLRNEIELEQQ